MEKTSKSSKTQMTQKKRKRRPNLSLDIPSDRIFFFFREEDKDKGSVYYPASLFYKLYQKKEKLGEGAAGLARRYEKRESGISYAVKITRTRDEEIFSQIKREFGFMRQIKHDNIIRAFELYYDEIKSRVFYVMEFVEGNNLEETIKQRGIIKEEKAKSIFRQLLEGIFHLHKNGIVHRDLKPDNILISEKDKLKILDFNVAKFQEESERKSDYRCFKWNNFRMHATTGTRAFSAPEILGGGGYTESVDAWSAGCILYNMLSGDRPFKSETCLGLEANIRSKEVDYRHSVWASVSIEAKNLISGLLKKDPEVRTTVYEAINSPWISLETSKIKNLKKKIKLVPGMSCQNLGDSPLKFNRTYSISNSPGSIQ